MHKEAKYTIEEILATEEQIKEGLANAEDTLVRAHNEIRALMCIAINKGSSAEVCNVIRSKLQKMQGLRNDIQNLHKQIDYVMYLLRQKSNLEKVIFAESIVQCKLIEIVNAAVFLLLPSDLCPV